jgi:ribosomal protein S28E/S33
MADLALLVEHTGRLVRDKKASISAELADIFERLGTSAELWQARVRRLSGGRLLGRFLGGSKERLAEVAQRLGVSRVANLKATG